MRIAVFGSWREADGTWPFRGSQAEFERACRELGAALSRQGHAVIVGSHRADTADRHVVEGVVEGAGETTVSQPLVVVLRPAHRGLRYEELAVAHPHLFTFYPVGEPLWQAARLVAVRDADVVLTVGGRKGTYLAGLATVVAGKRIVPVASFGGASERLVDAVERLAPASGLDMRQLRGPWSPFLRDLAVRLLVHRELPRMLIIHGRSDDWKQLREWLHGELHLSRVTVMGEEVAVGQSMPEKFEELASAVDGAIAVATPDDEGRLRVDGASALQTRARQNVWLEVGWFWGRLGRRRVMILCREEIEVPSDLRGVELYRYQSDPTDRASEIGLFVNRLKSSLA